MMTDIKHKVTDIEQYFSSAVYKHSSQSTPTSQNSPSQTFSPPPHSLMYSIRSRLVLILFDFSLRVVKLMITLLMNLTL